MLLLLLGTASCVMLYRYLGVYEISRPESVAEELTGREFRELTELLAESLDVNNYPFEDIRTLFRDYCEENLSDKKLTYYEDKSQRSENEAVFFIRAGGFNLCRVEVEADDTSELGFGRHTWKLGKITSEVLDSLDSVTLRVKAPENLPVYLNGKLLTESFITDADQIFPEMTELEASFDKVPKLVTYSVAPLYGEISVKDQNGMAITPQSVSVDELLAEIIPEKTSVRIEAPDDLSVIVGGIELNTDYIVNCDDGVFSGLDKYIGDQHWKMSVYQLDGLYEVPEITAWDASGCELTPVKAVGNYYRFYHENEPVPDEVKAAADSFFRAYLEYSSNGSGGDRYYNLINSMVFGTELHGYIVNSYEAMLWASKTELNIRELEFDNFSKVNDKCYYCTASYSADLTATSWVDQYSYSSGGLFDLVLAFEGGRWLVAAMSEVNIE